MIRAVLITLCAILFTMGFVPSIQAQTSGETSSQSKEIESAFAEQIDPEIFDAAFRKLKAQDQLQFELAEAPPEPEFKWLERLLEPFFRFLGAMLPLFKVIFWGFVIGAIALIVYIFVKAAMNFRVARRNRERQEQEDAYLYRPSHAQARILLQAVDSLAAEGRFAEAVHQLLFRSIQDIGISRPNIIRRSYTSREIANLSALTPDTRKAFSLIAAEVERSHFGGQMLDEAAFLRCRKAYAQFAVPERREQDLSIEGGLTA